MSTIDNITVILGPPAALENVAELVDELTNGSADLEQFFSELVGQPVRLKAASPTYFEKKGVRYPALMVSATDVVGADGKNLAQEVTAAFTRPETPSALAEHIGVRLGLESAKTFYTFGSSD